MDYMQEPEQVRITQCISASLLCLFAGILAIVYTMSHVREVVSAATGLVSIAALIAVVFYTQKWGESLHTRKELP
jgi:hypothetical protein